MKCPVCGCQKFFLKDPTDDYETYEFDLKDGQAIFAADPQEMTGDTETYCHRCSWHGPFAKLQG